MFWILGDCHRLQVAVDQPQIETYRANAGGLFEGNIVMHKYQHQPEKLLHPGWMLDGDGTLKLRQKDDTINLVRYEISIDLHDSTRSLKGLLSVPALENCEHGNLPQLSLDSKLSIQKTSGSQPRNMAVFSKMSTSHRSSAGMMTLAVGAAGVMSAGFVAPGLELESESPGCRVF